MSTALLVREVAYTFLPSALTATEFGPMRPRPFAHPAAPRLCVSLPLFALRLKTAIALLFDAATYTVFPSGLIATASEPRNGAGPRSARTRVQPSARPERSVRHPPAPFSCASAPTAVTGGRLRCGVGAPSAPAGRARAARTGSAQSARRTPMGRR